MDWEFKHVPTLVIGLGGTGNEVARMLKARFAERYPGQETLIRYLIIDTDRKSFRDGFWDREEQVLLRLSLMPRHLLAAFYNNEHADWLPQEPRINPDHFVNQESGAGLIRPIGRLYVQDQVAQVRDRLEKARSSLCDLMERKRTGTILGTGDFQVYLVSSLAGGTGAGAFLDVAALVREMFEENCFITGMFTLYSCYAEALRGDVDQARRSKANCYAALKELEFFMQEKDESQPHLYGIKFWDGSRINLYKRLFSACYLVENTNDSGTRLHSLAQVYQLCAQQLFHEIGSPLGEDYRSKINNLSFFQSGLSGEEWRDWGRKRRFSSFGNVSLVYPWEKVVKFCTSRLITEVAEARFLGQEPEAGAISLEFVSSLGLGYDRPPVVDEMLLEYQEEMLSFRLGEIEPESAEKVIARYQEEVEHSLYQGGEKAAGFNQARLEEWKRRLGQEVLQLAARQGALAAGAFLQSLTRQLEQVQALFRQTLEQCREEAGHLAQDLTEARSQLRKLGAFGRRLRGQALCRKAAGIYQNWLDVRLEREVLSALEGLVQRLTLAAREEAERVKAWQHELRLIAKEARQVTANTVFQDAREDDYALLVQEAVSREECEEFYRRYGPRDLQEVSERIWSLSGTGLKERITSVCASYFQALEKLDIVNLLRMRFGSGDKWADLLDELREICRPFWTAHLKHGEYYNQTCLIGIAKEGADFPPEVTAWARDRSDATRGIDCVNTCYPYAIDITVSSHGAFAGYLSGIKDYCFQYEQYLRGKEFPLHLHEHFKYLPELDPYRDRVSQFFALASAYGLIAENSEGYFFALVWGPLGWEYRYKTMAALKPVNWDELRNALFTAVPRRGDPAFLGATRESAMAGLAENSSFISLINRFIADRVKQSGRERVKQELEDYLQRLGGENMMLKEAQALKLFIAGRLSRERAYG